MEVYTWMNLIANYAQRMFFKVFRANKNIPWKLSYISNIYEYYEFHYLHAIMDKNNDTINDKFYMKVAFLMYTKMVNFRPQS